MELALVLNAKNGNTLWVDAASKEWENVRVLFEVSPDGKKAPLHGIQYQNGGFQT